MNHALSLVSLGSFLLLPSLLLIVHALFPKYMPWWGVFLGVMAGGWVLLNARVFYYFRSLDDLIRATPNPPRR